MLSKIILWKNSLRNGWLYQKYVQISKTLGLFLSAVCLRLLWLVAISALTTNASLLPWTFLVGIWDSLSANLFMCIIIHSFTLICPTISSSYRWCHCLSTTYEWYDTYKHNWAPINIGRAFPFRADVSPCDQWQSSSTDHCYFAGTQF